MLSLYTPPTQLDERERLFKQACDAVVDVHKKLNAALPEEMVDALLGSVPSDNSNCMFIFMCTWDALGEHADSWHARAVTRRRPIKTEHCANCNRLPAFVCGGCLYACYCDRKCQHESRQKHSKWCLSYTVKTFADLLRLYLLRVKGSNASPMQIAPLVPPGLRLMARSPPHPMNAPLAKHFVYCVKYTAAALQVLKRNKVYMNNVELLALSVRARKSKVGVSEAVAEYFVEVYSQYYSGDDLDYVLNSLKDRGIAHYCMLIGRDIAYVRTFFSLPRSTRDEIVIDWRNKQEGAITEVLRGTFCSCP